MLHVRLRMPLPLTVWVVILGLGTGPPFTKEIDWRSQYRTNPILLIIGVKTLLDRPPHSVSSPLAWLRRLERLLIRMVVPRTPTWLSLHEGSPSFLPLERLVVWLLVRLWVSVAQLAPFWSPPQRLYKAFKKV